MSQTPPVTSSAAPAPDPVVVAPPANASVDTSAIQQAVQDVVPEVPVVIKDVQSGNIVGAVEAGVDTAGKVAPLVNAVVTEAKAGYKTTEFWLTLAFTILTQLGALHLPGHYGTTIATAAAIVAYVLSRGIAKHGKGAVVPATQVGLEKKDPPFKLTRN